MKRGWIILVVVSPTLLLISYMTLKTSRLGAIFGLGAIQFSDSPLETATVSTCNTYFSTRRYALAVEYWEQLTQATLNLFSLAHLAQDWGARTIVPFTSNSYLFGLPTPKRDKLDVLFNISKMNTMLFCEKYNLPPLADFEEFLRTADRRIVYVYVVWKYKYVGNATKQFRRMAGINCDHHSQAQEAGNSVLETLNNAADRMRVKKFSITSYCCINPHNVLSTSNIAETCNFVDTNATLIFNTWTGHVNSTMKRSLRLLFPGTQTPGRPACNDMLPCSKGIHSNSSAFAQSFSHGKEFIAFHFRATKIGKIGKKYTDMCMKEVFALRDKLMKVHPEIPIKYFVDYGEFGAMDDKAKEFVIPYIKRDKMIPLHYNPDEFGGLRDNGFVSLVEKSAIANAKILVLVGRGCFQAELATRMQAEPTSERIYYICKDRFAKPSSFGVHH